MQEIEQARARINEIDQKMADLFCQRMRAVETIAQYKKERGLQPYDAEREKEVIRNASQYIDDEVLRQYYVSFLQSNMDISKKYQQRLLQGIKVAYSGVEGAFADIAASEIFRNAEKKCFENFFKAYEAVEAGECDCCVLPIENSFAGEVGQVIDLIFYGTLYINGIYSLEIRQNLLGIKGSRKEDIKEVISHPQALSQCSDYLKKMGCKLTNSVNTAVAAKEVFDRNDKSLAAVASSKTANIYGLDILDHDINESAVNTTKFAVLSRVQNKPADAKKIIMLFSVKQVAGALAKAIDVMGKYGCNMLALRSRPIKEPAWQYYFYVEAEFDSRITEEKKMLEEMSKQCEMLKVVGYYDDVRSLGR